MTTDTTPNPIPEISAISAGPIPDHGRAIVGYDSEPSPQFVWSVMARLVIAQPMSHYLSDLWHDAQALAHAIPIAGREGDSLRWVYGMSDTHTHLYWVSDAPSEREAHRLSAAHDERTFGFRLARDERSRWVLTWGRVA